jgi:hypothetical protein
VNALVAGALAFATDPSPNPTENQLRPGLEEWQVSPGLIGFLVTFVLAVACVLLFLNMSKHLRRAGHNARQQGLPIAESEGIAFRRTDGDAEFGAAGSAGTSAAAAAGDGPGAAGTADQGGSSPDDSSPSGADSANGAGRGGSGG